MTESDRRRLWLGAAGLFGAVGVALAALGAHGEGVFAVPSIAIASRFFLIHALALLGVAALTRPGARWLTVAGALFAAGGLAFAGGLCVATLVGGWAKPLVPIGGTALIAGWIALFVAAFADPHGAG